MAAIRFADLGGCTGVGPGYHKARVFLIARAAHPDMAKYMHPLRTPHAYYADGSDGSGCSSSVELARRFIETASKPAVESWGSVP